MIEPASPCTGVCRLDDAERSCIGCGRTLNEIARWPLAGNAEKQAMLAALRKRMAETRLI